MHFVVERLVNNWSVSDANLAAFVVHPGERVLAPMVFDGFLALSLERFGIVLYVIIIYLSIFRFSPNHIKTK